MPLSALRHRVDFISPSLLSNDTAMTAMTPCGDPMDCDGPDTDLDTRVDEHAVLPQQDSDVRLGSERSGTPKSPDPDWDAFINFPSSDDTQIMTGRVQGHPSLQSFEPGDPYSSVVDVDKAKSVDQSNDWEARYNPGDFSSRFDFRQKPRSSRLMQIGILADDDYSGDFDPNEEPREARAAAARSKSARQKSRVCKKNDGSAADSSSEDNDEFGHKEACEPVKLEVVLRFQSPDGRSRFGQLTAALPASTGSAHDDFTQGYRLRDRENPTSTVDEVHNAYSTPKELIGHPAARGCYACHAIGERCPLLDDEFAWPCSVCQEDDEDCFLITEPKVKLSCESCRRKKLRCSFAVSTDHTGPCDRCKSEGSDCLAAPAKHIKNERARYENFGPSEGLSSEKEDVVMDEAPTISETIDDETENSITSYGTSKKETPIAIDIPIESTFEAETTPAPLKTENSVSPRPFPPTSQPSSQLDPSPPQTLRTDSRSTSRTGVTRTVTTKFSHPIRFNHQPSNLALPEQDPCHFCANPALAILGFGARQVKVIDWDDGSGLQEIRGGHRGEGVDNTRICACCTSQRLQIVMCAQHRLKVIDGLEGKKLDQNAGLGELIERKRELTFRWCSVCTSLARYECSEGCGLSLCDDCHGVLGGRFAGNFQGMLKVFQVEPPKRGPLGLRADFDLLQEHGLLVRFVIWSSSRN